MESKFFSTSKAMIKEASSKTKKYAISKRNTNPYKFSDPKWWDHFTYWNNIARRAEAILLHYVNSDLENFLG